LYFPEEFLGASVSNNNNNPGKYDIIELQKTAILGYGHCINIKENIEHGN
jgi:hypothetical protein